MTVRLLRIQPSSELVGRLPTVSKMPACCHSWGIPAKDCGTGSRLAAVAGSICQICYAMKGAYVWDDTKKAYQRRLDRWKDLSATPEGLERWISAMAVLAQRRPLFRWFDSGDLQSLAMLEAIAEVCRRTPKTRHWLPTKEYGIVAKWVRSGAKCPRNLAVRVSAAMIGAKRPKLAARLGLLSSTCHAKGQIPDGRPCLAYETTPARCGDCRACWDKRVKNVSYPAH